MGDTVQQSAVPSRLRSMTIIVRAELTAVAGRRDEFADVARASADEPGTARYDWYQGADPADFVVIEEYVDSEAASLTTPTARNCSAASVSPPR